MGHETDYTIADFVADLRAPTPSAAAEQVVQAKVDLAARVASLEGRLHAAVRLRLTRMRARVEAVTSHRVFTAERGRVRTYAQRVDDLLRRGETAAAHRLARARDGARRMRERLEAFRLDRQLAARREPPAASEQRLRGLFARRLEAAARALAGPLGQARHPLAPRCPRRAAMPSCGTPRDSACCAGPGDASVGDALRDSPPARARCAPPSPPKEPAP